MVMLAGRVPDLVLLFLARDQLLQEVNRKVGTVCHVSLARHLDHHCYLLFAFELCLEGGDANLL